MYFIEFIYDINDNVSIINTIKDADRDGRDLDIYIDSYGGDVLASDNILCALKTFQMNGGTVICIVDEKAMSAATLLALSSNVLWMDRYGVLGPTDPIIRKKSGTYSIKSYLDVLDDDKFKCAKVQIDELVRIRDYIKMYHDNYDTFKNLTQIKTAAERMVMNNRIAEYNDDDLQSLVDLFCSGKYPHHRPITFDELTKTQILDIELINVHHRDVLRVLKNVK
jgi:ClpP class serine protease